MFGFDFGTCNLKIAQFEKNRVKRLVSVEMPENLVKDGIITSYEAMADFLKQTVRNQRLKGSKEAAVVIAPGLSFIRRTLMPAMDAKSLQVNLPYEFRDYFTMDKDKYFYDYCVNGIVKKEADEEGREATTEMDLTIAAIAKSTIADYRKMFHRAGFKMVTAIPAECAYSNIIAAGKTDDIKEYCFLDLGHYGTRLNIYTGTAFETSRNNDTGLYAVDLALAEEEGIDRRTANSYKVANRDNCQNSESAMQVYNNIALDIRKALNFYSFNNRESNLSEIFCCGGGENIKPLLAAIGDMIEMNIHPASVLLPAIDPEAGDEKPDSYVLAIGAAIQKKEGR